MWVDTSNLVTLFHRSVLQYFSNTLYKRNQSDDSGITLKFLILNSFLVFRQLLYRPVEDLRIHKFSNCEYNMTALHWSASQPLFIRYSLSTATRNLVIFLIVLTQFKCCSVEFNSCPSYLIYIFFCTLLLLLLWCEIFWTSLQSLVSPLRCSWPHNKENLEEEEKTGFMQNFGYSHSFFSQTAGTKYFKYFGDGVWPSDSKNSPTQPVSW